MGAHRLAYTAWVVPSRIVAVALFAGLPSIAHANLLYEYRSTCDSMTVPGVTGVETIQCSTLSSDAISVNVTVRDSYVPGTDLTPDDVLSVVYHDPYPFTAEFDQFGPGDINGFLPVVSGGPGRLIVLQGISDIALRIEGAQGWTFFLLGGNELHFANGPPGEWFRIAEPGTLALAICAMLLLGTVGRSGHRSRR